MRLYTFRQSPNPLKVRIAIAELALEIEQIEVNLFEGEHRSESFGDVNPHRKVPVLVDGALVLPESNAIIAYLGKTRGGDLWPKDSASEAQALRWLFFDSFSLGNQCGSVWWTDVVSKAIGRPGAAEEVVDDAIGDLERSLSVLDKHLADSDYLLGSGFSLCDCAVGVAVTMLEGTRIDSADRFPAITKYRQRFQSRPSFERAGGDAIRHFA